MNMKKNTELKRTETNSVAWVRMEFVQVRC